MSAAADSAPASGAQLRELIRPGGGAAAARCSGMYRVLLLCVLAGCPEPEDTEIDYVYTCPEAHGGPFALGTDRGDSRGRDAVGSMVPGSTQLMTIGRSASSGGADFSGRFDVDVLGARGIDLVRVSDNQFLLRAEAYPEGEWGSACIQLSDVANPTDVTNVAFYVARPLSTYVTARGATRDPVFMYGTPATVALATGGGFRIVDSGLRFVHGSRVYPTAYWDTVTLVELGSVPLDVITSDGTTRQITLDVVAAPDEVVVSAPAELPRILTAGSQTQFCVYGTYQGRMVANVDWTWTVTNANWTTDNGLGEDVPGCVRVTPTTAGQRVEIVAEAGRATRVLAFDVQ